MCSILLYVKRIIVYNQRYGRYAFILGAVFIGSNVLAGGLNFYLGSGGWEPVMNLKQDNIVVWCLIFVPYYALTEFTPAVMFALVMQKYGEVTELNRQ